MKRFSAFICASLVTTARTDIVVAGNGNIYVTNPVPGGTEPGKIWLIKPGGEKKVVDSWLHVPDAAEDRGADGIRVDRDGRLYVATRLGIQVCDQAGRVNGIIPRPNNRVSNLCFGGENFDPLVATCGDRVYQRKRKVQGAHAWAATHQPAAPRL
jgi:sugar lactone lactonase YvrE